MNTQSAIFSVDYLQMWLHSRKLVVSSNFRHGYIVRSMCFRIIADTMKYSPIFDLESLRTLVSFTSFRTAVKW